MQVRIEDEVLLIKDNWRIVKILKTFLQGRMAQKK